MFKKVLGYIFVLVCVAVFVVSCETDRKKEGEEPASAAEIQKLSDPKNCGTCHQKQYKDWEGSHHALALRLPHDSLFLKLPDTVRLSENRWYALYKKGNQYRINTQDYFDHKTGDFEIKFIIGVDPLLQYIAEIPGGKNQCLTFALDTRKKEYFDLKYDTKAPAGDWLHWTGQTMNWNAACADCHSTNVKKNYNPATDTYNTTFRDIQITCEGCHGTVKSLPEDPKKCWLPASQRHDNKSQLPQIDKCAQCHSRRMQLQDGKVENVPFDDNYSLEAPSNTTFHGDGQIKDEVFEYHSFTQSKMYAKGVKCSNCHNTHSGKLLATGNTLCINCHDKKKFDTESHHFHPIQSEGAKCVNCHMPGKFYMKKHFRHDHSLRVPRPDLSVKFGTPNACNNCHKDKKASWAAAAVEKHHGKVRKQHFSDVILNADRQNLASVTAIVDFINNEQNKTTPRLLALNKYNEISSDEEKVANLSGLMKDPSPLLRTQFLAIINDKGLISNQLTEALNDKSKTVRVQAARFYNILEPTAPGNVATQEYLTMAHFNEDNATIIMDLANYHYQKNNVAEAIRLYKKALTKDDKLPDLYVNLTQIYNNANQKDSALALLKKGIQKVPEYPEFYFYTGLLLVEKGEIETALQNFNKAIALDPYNAQYAYNVSVIMMQQNKWKDAEKLILKAIKLEPGNPKYTEALMYLRQKKGR